MWQGYIKGKRSMNVNTRSPSDRLKKIDALLNCGVTVMLIKTKESTLTQLQTLIPADDAVMTGSSNTF